MKAGGFFCHLQIVIEMKDGECPSPKAMANQVLWYLEENGYLQP
jgi:adenylylsulfate kinase